MLMLRSLSADGLTSVFASTSDCTSDDELSLVNGVIELPSDELTYVRERRASARAQPLVA